MKIIVLGTGIIGITTTYYLAKCGHKVIAIDRQPKPAFETSFANGGQISASHAWPWASPGVARKVIASFSDPDAPFLFRPRLNLRQWIFGMAFLSNASAVRFHHNTKSNVALSAYSAKCLRELLTSQAIPNAFSETGILTVFEDHDALEATANINLTVNHAGGSLERISEEKCKLLEPALTRCNQLAGGIFAAEDFYSNAFDFAQCLMRECRSMGAEFLMDTTIKGWSYKNFRAKAAQTSKGEFSADAFVVATGATTASIMRQLGIGVPVYPIKGYSISIPITDQNHHLMPSKSITHEQKRIVITPLKDGLRVAGLAELDDFNLQTIDLRRIDTIKSAVSTILPGIIPDNADLKPWVGLRPMTPDCLPIIGVSPCKNVYLNVGHGSFGWTQACGSGKLVSDLISGTTPDHDLKAFRLERFPAWARI